MVMFLNTLEKYENTKPWLKILVGYPWFPLKYHNMKISRERKTTFFLLAAFGFFIILYDLVTSLCDVDELMFYWCTSEDKGIPPNIISYKQSPVRMSLSVEWCFENTCYLIISWTVHYNETLLVCVCFDRCSRTSSFLRDKLQFCFSV